MRFPHFLSKNTKCEAPSHFIFVDTETFNVEIESNKYEARLKMGVACYYRNYKMRGKQYIQEEWLEFTTTDEFNNWLLSKLYDKTNLWCFAHNMKFDFQVLGVAKFMMEHDFTTDIAVIDSPPFFIRYRNAKKAVMFICSMNYFVTSLKKLGESIGEAKLKMPVNDAPKEEWQKYNRQDVVVLKTAILLFIDFVKQHNLGNFQKTLASQAFSAYRHRFMNKSIFIHSDESVLEMERNSYHGGRTECFFIGERKDNFYLLDVNSMYPAVMFDNEFPFQLQGTTENIDIITLKQLLKVYCCVAQVEIQTNIPVYPLVQDNKIIFPIGNFITYLTTPEIKFALENNHIKQIIKVAVYRKSKIFYNYVDELYKLRLQYKQQNNSAFEYMLKIMMNSLYGKFGQSGKHWNTIDTFPDLKFEEWIEKDIDTGEIKKYRKLLGTIQIMQQESESRHSFPAIAAHVTAYSRILLWNYITLAGCKNVFYCDTDSLLVNSTGLNNLKPIINKYKLGALKLEKEFSYINIRSPKDYVFDKIVKIKGVRKQAIKISENEFQQDQFWGISHAWSQEIYDKQIIQVITKKLSRIYTKGIIKENGIVEPFHISI